MTASRLLVSFFLVGGGGLLCAQTPPPAQPEGDEAILLALLNTPVESASKRVQRAIDSPQAVEVISADQIKASGAFRLADVLRLATSLQVMDADPDRAMISIRGVSPSGNPRTVQVLIDGVPMFNIVASPMDINGLPVPIDAIERIEIVRGPSSSLYGANAQFGVIAITTKRAKDGVQGSLRAGAGDHGTSREQAYFGYGSKGFAFTAGVAAGANGSMDTPMEYLAKPGVTVPQNTKSRYLQAFLRPELIFGDTRLWLAAGVGDTGHVDQQSFGASNVALAQVVFPDMVMKRQLLQAGWAQTWSPTFKSELKAGQKTFDLHLGALQTVAANPASPTILGLLAASDPAMKTDHNFYHDQVRELSLQLNWDPAASFHAVAGLDSKTIDTGECLTLGLIGDRSFKASGGFFSVDWTVGAATLSAGARAAKEDLGGSSTSPRASIVYQLDESSVLRAGYFTSTRSPMVQERDNVIGNSPVVTTLYIANPGLKSESVDDFELGYRRTFSRWSLDVTWFSMKLKDLIVNAPTGAVVSGKAVTQWINTPNSFTDSGFEVALTGELAAGWLLGVNASTCSFKDPIYGLDQQADYSPKGQANLWTRFRKGRFFAFGAVQYVGSYTVSLPPGTARQTIDGAAHLHFNVGFEPMSGLSLSAYGVDASRATSQSSNSALLNQFGIRTSRRELGLQAAWRF